MASITNRHYIPWILLCPRAVHVCENRVALATVRRTGDEKQSHLLDSLSAISPSTHVVPQSSTPGDSVTPRG